MYIAKIPNRGSPPTYLLRESFRRNGKVRTRTLANLSTLPLDQIKRISRVLKGDRLVPVEQNFRITRSLPHGHVQAVLVTVRRLGLEALIASRPCRERDLVVAMIAQRILYPSSKLAATRLWETTTLGEELGVLGAEVDELYAALDWLLQRQRRIENKLAKRHLGESQRVLYDVSSSSYFGHTCLLARWGNNRDGRRDLPCIVYGVMTDAQGRPIALDVYPGNTGDPTTVPDQVEKLRQRFGLERVVLVGDRGMLTQAQIDKLRKRPGLGWLSALRSEAIRKLIEKGHLERSLFDETNLAEISSPDFPEERLVACFNPILAERRRRKRDALLTATETQLARIAAEVKRRTKTPLAKAAIGIKAGRVLNKYKVGKHFALSIEDGQFTWRRKQEAIDEEAALDGIYVIRGSEPAEQLSADDAVRNYKQLGDVEHAFRTLKGLELLVRPIHHRIDDRVRAHLFVCLLAYYVTWHLKRAWSPLLFADEQLAEHRARRDPVLPAQAAAEVREKKRSRRTQDGYPVHSFRTLLAALGTQCRDTCQFGDGEPVIEIGKLSEPTPLQTEAFRLLEHECSQQA
jgi:transposase